MKDVSFSLTETIFNMVLGSGKIHNWQPFFQRRTFQMADNVKHSKAMGP